MAGKFMIKSLILTFLLSFIINAEILQKSATVRMNPYEVDHPEKDRLVTLKEGASSLNLGMDVTSLLPAGTVIDIDKSEPPKLLNFGFQNGRAKKDYYVKLKKIKSVPSSSKINRELIAELNKLLESGQHTLYIVYKDSYIKREDGQKISYPTTQESQLSDLSKANPCEKQEDSSINNMGKVFDKMTTPQPTSTSLTNTQNIITAEPVTTEQTPPFVPTDDKNQYMTPIEEVKNFNNLEEVIIKNQNETPPGEAIFEAYKNFQKKFKKKYKDLPFNGTNKQLIKNAFIKELWEELGPEYADKIVTALTAYGEARGSGRTKKSNMAEMAAVVQTLRNRAITSYSTTALTLDEVDIPINRDPKNSSAYDSPIYTWDSKNDNRRMAAALHAKHFSAWNLNDPNLDNMIFDTNSKIETALTVVDMADRGLIDFGGGLEKKETRHYHAKSWIPHKGSWAYGRTSLSTPKVKFFTIKDNYRMPDSEWLPITTHKMYNRVP